MNQEQDIKCDISPDTMRFRVLCPTRWTVRSETFRSILEDYVSFLQMWESMLESRLDSDARAHVHGFNSQMRTFDFTGLNLLFNLLRHTDNFSKTLQNTLMCAVEGQHLAAMTVATLGSTRNEEAFEMFWGKTLTESAMLDIGHPTVPRKHKPPRSTGSEAEQYTLAAVDHYRGIYYETFDTITSCIKDRFDHEGYCVYSKLENLLVKGKVSEDEIDEVMSFYKTDFDKIQLTTQLVTYHANYPAMNNKCVHA